MKNKIKTHEKEKTMKNTLRLLLPTPAGRWLAAVLLLAAAVPLCAQQPITLDEALGKALSNYPAIRAGRLQAQSAAMLSKSASALGEMEISGGGEEIGRGNEAIYTLARVRQNIDPFGANGLRQRLQAQAKVAQAETGVAERTLSRQVCLDYINDYAEIGRASCRERV